MPEQGAFAEYVTTGSLGRFEGFLAGLWEAAFVITGPEYVAMLAGESMTSDSAIFDCSARFPLTNHDHSI